MTKMKSEYFPVKSFRKDFSYRQLNNHSLLQITDGNIYSFRFPGNRNVRLHFRILHVHAFGSFDLYPIISDHFSLVARSYRLLYGTLRLDVSIRFLFLKIYCSCGRTRIRLYFVIVLDGGYVGLRVFLVGFLLLQRRTRCYRDRNHNEYVGSQENCLLSKKLWKITQRRSLLS